MRHALAQTTCRTSMLHVRPARPQSISVQLHATSKAWGRRWWSCEAKYSSAQNSKPRSSHFLAEQHNVAWSSGRRNLESRIQADESRCCHRGWNNVLGARTFHSGTGMRTNERADIQRVPPSTRRTLASRPVIHEDIYNLPNILTFSRLLAAPAIGYLIINDIHNWALGLFVYAGVTDALDGWIARKWKLQTVVGSVVDPMADKALMTVATVSLAIQGGMPMYLAVIILGRDGLLALSAIYYRYISLPQPKTFVRYWDFSLPSAEVHPTGISKANTVFQLGLIAWTVAMPMIRMWGWSGAGVEAGLVGMQYFVAMTTVWSGASYIYTKDAVKILSQEEAREKEKEQERDMEK